MSELRLSARRSFLRQLRRTSAVAHGLFVATHLRRSIRGVRQRRRATLAKHRRSPQSAGTARDRIFRWPPRTLPAALLALRAVERGVLLRATQHRSAEP